MQKKVYLCTRVMTYFLSLGSNISPRHRSIDEACRLLNERCGTILRRSSDYFSMPVGYVSDHEYLNICVVLDSLMDPMELLWATQQIERELGRTQKNHYSDRTIDIDLLQAFDAQGREATVHTNELTLPHPRMQERDFVLIPLREIIP